MEVVASSQTVLMIGAVLLHFVWQGLLVGIVSAVILAVVPRSAAQVRYILACASLVALMVAPLATLTLAWQTSPANAASLLSVRAVDAVEVVTASEWSATALATWLPTIVAVWVAGVLLQATRLATALWRTERVRRADVREADGLVLALMTRMRDRLGVSRNVALFESPWIDTPTVIGWLRPTVLLPIGAFTGLSTEQVEAVLAHELAHIRRHDYVVNTLQHLAETVFFYHPAVWWLSRQIRIEREHCCDDVAVEACGDPVAYVRALTALEQGRHERAALALAATDGSLVERARRLLGRPQHEGRQAVSILLSIVVLLSIVGVASARALTDSASQPTGTIDLPPPGSGQGGDNARTFDERVSETIFVAPPQARGPVEVPAEGPQAEPDQDEKPQIIRIGGDIKEPQKIQHVNPIYPESAREAGISGVVILEATIEADGSVSGLHILRSIPDLDQAAINAVRQWRYTPTLLNGEPVRVVMTVTVNFTLRHAEATAPGEHVESLRVAAREGSEEANAPNVVSGRPPQAADATDSDIPRVGGDVREPVKVRNVSPVYPRIAQANNVSGVVIMEVTIDAAGNVTNASILRSIPMLDQAALDAVRQWKYAPAIVDGQPSPVRMTVTVNFTLN